MTAVAAQDAVGCNQDDVRVALVAIDDVDGDFVERWSRLAGVALEPNPFFEPTMVLAAAKHLTAEDTLRLLVAERDGELTFLLPVVQRARYRRLPVRTLTSWAHDHSYLATPLLSSQGPEEIWAGVLAYLRRERPTTWFCLDGVGNDGPVADALADACRGLGITMTTMSSSERATLDRTVTNDYVKDVVSSSRRKALRRRRRQLEVALGGPIEVVDVAAGPAVALRSAVDHFLELEAAGWKGADGGAMRCSPGHAEFFATLCSGLARTGQLELLRLGRGEVVVAYACNLRSHGREFGFKVAYDPEFARFSPGVLLELEKLAALAALQREVHYDACASPDNELCNRLFTDRRTIASVVVPLASGPNRLVCAVAPRLFRGRERLRKEGNRLQ